LAARALRRVAAELADATRERRHER
jgi:hypothetical protein